MPKRKKKRVWKTVWRWKRTWKTVWKPRKKRSDRFALPFYPASRRAEVSASSRPIDILLPLGSGSKNNDLELRVALRSIHKNVQGLRKVWVVGHKPAWFRDSDFAVSVPRQEFRVPKESRIAYKVMWAFETLDITDAVAFWNDDYVVTLPADIRDIPAYYCRTLVVSGGGSRRYSQIKRATSDALIAAGNRNLFFDVHTPIIYERNRFLSLKEWWGNNYVVKSIYGNHFCIDRAVRCRDCKFGTRNWPNTLATFAEQKRWMFSYDDYAFGRLGLSKWLMAAYPEPSPAEAY